MRPWPGQPHVAQLVLYAQGRVPRSDHLAAWLDDLRLLGFTTARTNALAGEAARLVAASGFECVQRLVLLEHTDPSAVARGRSTIRLGAVDDGAAASVDRAAFAAPWALDAPSIADVRLATPRHRFRGCTVTPADGELVAFAISGRDARQGFLQRLAVHPDHHRCGHATALVADSLAWMARWRVGRVLVNTHTDNTAALALYDTFGFVRLADELRVFERGLS